MYHRNILFFEANVDYLVILLNVYFNVSMSWNHGLQICKWCWNRSYVLNCISIEKKQRVHVALLSR